MSDLRELYQQVIIEHARTPRNFGELKCPSHEAEGYNPICGDLMKIYLIIKDNHIDEVKFSGAGCAISTASASLMTELLEGKSLEEAEKFFQEFVNMVTKDEPAAVGDLGKLTILSGVKEFPMRVKCATLAWHTLLAALKNKKQIVSTE